MKKNPFLTGKDLLAFQESFENKIKEDQLKQQRKATLEQEAYTETAKTVIQNEVNRNLTVRKYNEFVNSVKESFLGECMYELFKRSMNESHDLAKEEPIMRSLVSKYIKENGAANIIRSLGTKSYVLSEMSLIIEKACKETLDKCDPCKPDSFAISTQIRDDFYDSLKASDMEDLSDTIAMRVSSAESEFVMANRIDKMAIEDILRDAKEKIDSAKESEKAKVEESANIIAKRKISQIRTGGSKNLYHHIVEGLLRSTLKDDALKQHFTENGEVSMDKITSYANTMYTFLEMLNTSKIEVMTVDKAKDLLASM